MAISGLPLVLFACVHMIGNLQIFIGPEAINRYAHFLQSTGELLWVSRISLFIFVMAHICTSVTLTLENYRARPQAYKVREAVGASWASRTMIWTGLAIAAYVVYHILHFTAGTLGPSQMELIDPQSGYHDVYRMVVMGFEDPVNAVGYILMMGMLCFHLSHGVGALFSSLGLKNQVYECRIKRLAQIVASVLFVGYSAVPLSILLGLVK